MKRELLKKPGWSLAYGEVILHDHNGNAATFKWFEPLSRWRAGWHPADYLVDPDRDYLMDLINE
jgi:hypothetical protein